MIQYTKHVSDIDFMTLFLNFISNNFYILFYTIQPIKHTILCIQCIICSPDFPLRSDFYFYIFISFCNIYFCNISHYHPFPLRFFIKHPTPMNGVPRFSNGSPVFQPLIPIKYQHSHVLSKCKRVEKSGKELNVGQHIFEWKLFTQKGVSL